MSGSQSNKWSRKIRDKIIHRGIIAYLRRAVWVFLGVDVLATLLFVSISSAPPENIEVWFETGMPSNFIMIKTFADSTTKDVEVILDGRYFYTWDELPPGTSGLQIETDFLTTDETVPIEGYRPEQVDLKIGDERFHFDLERRKK